MKLVEELHLAIGGYLAGGGAGLRGGMSWLGHADADQTQNDHGDGADAPFLPVGSTAIGAWRVEQMNVQNNLWRIIVNPSIQR